MGAYIYFCWFALQFSEHLDFHLDRKNELITTTALVLSVKTCLTMCRVKKNNKVLHIIYLMFVTFSCIMTTNKPHQSVQTVNGIPQCFWPVYFLLQHKVIIHVIISFCLALFPISHPAVSLLRPLRLLLWQTISSNSLWGMLGKRKAGRAKGQLAVLVWEHNKVKNSIVNEIRSFKKKLLAKSEVFMSFSMLKKGVFVRS